jgi:hypothetical protein
MSTSEEETREIVGRQGNVYEENSAHTRHPPLATRLRREAARPKVPEAASEALEQGERAHKAIEAGAPTTVDHGAPVGAQNVLKFHQWKKNSGEG